MKIVVVGASRGVGRAVAKHAKELGHDVLGFVRSAPDLGQRIVGIDYYIGDAAKSGDIECAIARVDAVICTLGADDTAAPTLYSTCARNLSAIMPARAVNRLIFLSNFGVQNERSWHPLTASLMAVSRRKIAGTLKDHSAALAVLRSSPLEWTAVRPMVLTQGKLRRHYRVASDGELPFGGLRVSREDVAHFMISQLEEDTYVRRCPAIAY